jgi:hypothetical protein
LKLLGQFRDMICAYSKYHRYLGILRSHDLHVLGSLLAERKPNGVKTVLPCRKKLSLRHAKILAMGVKHLSNMYTQQTLRDFTKILIPRVLKPRGNTTKDRTHKCVMPHNAWIQLQGSGMALVAAWP